MGEQWEAEGEGIPVFLINGFLESGKSSFIQFTMEQEYFQTEGNTLLLLCEDGEVEYDPLLSWQRIIQRRCIWKILLIFRKINYSLWQDSIRRRES